MNYPPIDHSKYAYTRDQDRPWSTDLRHIDILYRLSLALPPDSLIVEIGCWRGATATAYLEAMRYRQDLRLRLYDIKLRKQLKHLVWKSGPNVRDRVEIVDQPCWHDLSDPAALAFIDADHGWPALADLASCLAVGCRVIAAHDVHYDSPEAHGSRLLGDILRASHYRRYYEDYEVRPGEWTERGFIVSWLLADADWVLPALPPLTPACTNVPLAGVPV